MELPVINEKRNVYMDHAAGTPVDSRVLAKMIPYFTEEFGNPSALYRLGRRAKETLHTSRVSVAAALNASSGEIIFTGSGTESDNMAIFGVARKYKSVGNKILMTTFEHHAMLFAGDMLKKEGFIVEEMPVSHEGILSAETLEKALTQDTIFVSVMYANNEVGTIQDISVLAKVIRDKKKEWGRGPNDAPFFHTDACQATEYLSLDTKKLGVDLMTINGSKMYGPKGTGVLFVRNGVKISPLIIGGGQENKMRGGTENLPGIVGLAEALHITQEERETEQARLTELRDYMIAELFKRIPKIVLNGHATQRLPNNVNVSILDIEGEAILLYLDEYGISASTGSACDSQSLEPSHVILALGRPYEFAHGSMRFTLGRSTTKEDIDYVVNILDPVCNVLRKISPIDVDVTAYGTDGMSMPSAFVGGQTPHFVKKEQIKNK